MALFKKATKLQLKLRLALLGPTGSGKTFTALRIAKGLGGKIAVIDTERRSASKYSGEFDFDVLELESFSADKYVEAIKAAEAEGYDVLVIDSLSHAWMGKDGSLETVDKIAKRSQTGNSFVAWRDVTPMHNTLVDTILSARMHVIVTMRVKMEYVLEEDSRGKKTPRKIGLQPQQRDGVEYEFDVIADIDQEHNFIVSKTRCRALDGLVVKNAGEDVADRLKAWLSDGEAVVEPGVQLVEMIRAAQTLDERAKAGALAKDKWAQLNAAERQQVTEEMKLAQSRIERAIADAKEAEAVEREIAAAQQKAEAAP